MMNSRNWEKENYAENANMQEKSQSNHTMVAGHDSKCQYVKIWQKYRAQIMVSGATTHNASMSKFDINIRGWGIKAVFEDRLKLDHEEDSFTLEGIAKNVDRYVYDINDNSILTGHMMNNFLP